MKLPKEAEGKLFKQIAIGFSRKCPFECAHCCTDSSSYQKKVLTSEQLRTIVDQVSEAGFEAVTFSQGESFLHPSLLLEGVRRAKEKEVPLVAVVTNAFWAKTPERALATLAPYAPYLDTINFSYSPYHREYSNPDWVRHAAEAATRLNIQNILIRSNFTGFTEEQQREEVERLRKEFPGLPARVGFAAHPLFFIGRASNLLAKKDTALPQTPKLVSELPRFNACIAINTMEIDEEGNFYPCCSSLLTFPNKKYVSIGNVFETPLRSLIQRLKEATLPLLFHYFGPGEFIRLLEMKYGKEKIAPIYKDVPPNDACFLCTRLMNHPLIRKLYPEGMRQGSYQRTVTTKQETRKEKKS